MGWNTFKRGSEKLIAFLNELILVIVIGVKMSEKTHAFAFSVDLFMLWSSSEDFQVQKKKLSFEHIFRIPVALFLKSWQIC